MLHVIDTPGHTDFFDEIAVAMRLSDGIVLVVDVAEGVSKFVVAFLIDHPRIIVRFIRLCWELDAHYVMLSRKAFP